MVYRVSCDKNFLEFPQKLWRFSALNRGEDTHNDVNNRIEHGHLGDVISLKKGFLDINADNAKRPRHLISILDQVFSCLIKKTYKN